MKLRIIKQLENGYSHLEAVNVIPFGICPTVNVKSEISGSSEQLVTVGRLAKKLGGITLVCADSDNLGVLHRSVFIFDGAKLISVCNQNYVEQKFSPSFGFKTFKIGGKKIGVLVDRDIYEPDAVKTFVFSECDAIIDLYADFCALKAHVAAEFYSYVYGIDFAVISKEESFVYTSDGSFLKGDGISEFNLNCNREYCERKSKRRGMAFGSGILKNK